MSTQSVTWLDGIVTTAVPLPDRGVDYGDGLFETLLLCQGKALYRELHLARLALGLQALLMPDCLARVQAALDVAVQDISERAWTWSALRISVTRGAGERGYAPSLDVPPRIIVTATQLQRDCAAMAPAANLAVSGIHLATQPALAGIKHANRLEQVLAAAEAQQAGADEALMLDTRGRPVSVIAGNLYVVRDGELCTPSLDSAGVAGTRRRLILDRWASEAGLVVRQVALTRADLAAAAEVFYSNSLYTVRPVATLYDPVQDLSWEKHPVCEALFNVFRGELPS